MADTNLEVRLTAEAGDLRSELRDVEQRLSSLNRAAAKAAKGTQQLQASSKGVSRGIGGIGRSAGQASIQMQQLVGQIQGGVNPSVALSQQAADLGFVLGVPLLGAVTAIAAGLAGPFIDALMGGKQAMQELNEEIDGVFGSLKNATPAVKQFRLLTLKNEAAEAATALRESQQALDDESKSIFTSQEQITQLTARRDLEQAKLKVIIEQIAKLTGVRNEEQSAVDNTIKKLEEQLALTGASSIAILKYRLANMGATASEIQRAVALQKSIDAIEEKSAADKKAAAEKAEADKKEDQRLQRSVAFMKRINKQRFDAIVAARDAQIQKEKEAAEIVARNQAAAHKSALEQMRAEQKRFENVIEGGLNTMADGFVGVIRGTNSLASAFNNMANQIINDLLRMAMQKLIVDRIMGAVFGGVSSIGTASGFTSVGPAAGAGGVSGGQAVLPGLADGGTARAGRAHIVGERGPELLVPGRTSQVVPNHALGGVNVTQNINISTGVQQTVRAEIAGLMPQIAEASKNAVIDARRRGGSFAGAFGA